MGYGNNSRTFEFLFNDLLNQFISLVIQIRGSLIQNDYLLVL